MEEEKDIDIIVGDILHENNRRNAEIYAEFNPYTGVGSTGKRRKLHIDDFPGTPVMYLPKSMFDVPMIRKLVRCRTIDNFIRKHLGKESTPELRSIVIKRFIRVRIKHDFPFWAAAFVLIKPKKPGALCHFVLNRPQRLLVEKLEAMRLAHVPIRIIILKARQWGGSTCIQMYMAWLQLVHLIGASSAIEAHQNIAASNIQKMFRTMLDNYPVELLHDPTDVWDEREKKWQSDPIVRSVIKIPSRQFEIQVGSAMNPESSRSSNVALAHCSEVAIYPDTDERTPQKLVNAVCSGILPEENTFIAYESTAKGEDNFFHDEYVDAKQAEADGDTDYLFKTLFIAWHQIESYSRNFKSDQAKYDFARLLWEGRNTKDAKDNRHEPGAYLWRLWNMGASLEAIYWYTIKRTEYSDHADMANEYPSDDIEAFRSSGSNVFDIYDIDELAKGVRDPKKRGDLQALGRTGEKALKDIRFRPDPYGNFSVWEEPEIFDDVKVTDRYIVTVDIGGRWRKADWSIISVIDRYWMMEGGKPKIVAQWVGHIDHDLLAYKAAQIAHWYDDALLVIESNTLETKDKERLVDGNQAEFILTELKTVYDNLYARKQSAEDIKEHMPVRYGFHTNTNTKPAIISNLIMLVRDQSYTERDAETINELKHYQLNNNVYEAAPKHHDDRLMTRAIGLWICYKEMELPKMVNKVKPIRKIERPVTEATII